jgi:hypothetical protein
VDSLKKLTEIDLNGLRFAIYSATIPQFDDDRRNNQPTQSFDREE